MRRRDCRNICHALGFNRHQQICSRGLVNRNYRRRRRRRALLRPDEDRRQQTMSEANVPLLSYICRSTESRPLNRRENSYAEGA